MALSIAKNDITKMEADAIVNSTNEFLQVGGFGVDASVHAAAGPKLEAALQEIGFCQVGSAVITDAFELANCRYIIHAVGPVCRHKTGLLADRSNAREEALLKECYQTVLTLAREHGCRSVAMPLISAGANGFPKKKAYEIATSAARGFLLSLDDGEDMEICIVLYDNEAVEIGGRLRDRIRHYISDHYRDEHRERQEAFYAAKESDGGFGRPAMYSRREEARKKIGHPTAGRVENRRAERVEEAASAPVMPSITAPRPGRDFEHEDTFEMAVFSTETSGEEENYRVQDRSFADMCEWWCEKKSITKKEFYTRANITRATFWNMKHNPEQVPKKTTVLACAIGLRLDPKETEDLLLRAGMALSHYYKLDVIVEYFIKAHNYDIDEINAMLFEEDQPLLGSVMR